jgi:uncharacterized protein YggE
MEGMPFEGVTGERLRKALLVMVILLAVFLAAEVLNTLEGLKYVGTGVSATNTISITGHGEAVAVPDIATFNYSVVSDKATVDEAQADATAKANATTDYLKKAGIDAKDIQTADYSINPQYDYVNQVCANGYCPGGKQVLKGYEVRQSTTVKVRDTKKAGELLAGVGGTGATEVVQTEARDKAIADAKAKADVLAKQLGVSLVRVVSFNENGSGVTPRPMMYNMAAGSQAKDAAAVAPTISTGQNRVTDDVSITYEIR